MRATGEKSGWLWMPLVLSVFCLFGYNGLYVSANSQPLPTRTMPADHRSSRLGNDALVAEANDVPREFTVHVSPTVKQGQALLIRIEDAARMARSPLSDGYVMLADRKAKFFPQNDGAMEALASVSVFQKPGHYSLSIYGAGNELLKTMPVTILDAHYRTQNVTVSKTTEGLKPLPGELEAVQALKDTVTDVKYWEEPFISPTPDCENSPFGVKRLHNGVPTGDYHKGVDLRSPAGRPIRATNGGRVQIAQMFRLHGGTVGLDHGQGVSSIYIHMSRLNVKPGELVKKGDVIGYVGSTGFATGPHLHWGMYMSGLPINPDQWITNVPTCR